MRNLLLCIVMLVFVQISWSQDQLDQGQFIHIMPRYQDQVLSLQDTIFRSDIDHVQIETIRFYVSNFTFLHQKEVVWKEKESHHLVDAADTSSFRFPLHGKAPMIYDEITFLLGIDSLTSTSGAFGGDLDPTNGMYWAWNSGYINFKIEGKSSQCPTRDKRFQFHLGGYAPPYANSQLIRLPVNSSNTLSIAVDLSNFFDQIDLSEEHTIMSPSSKAVLFSELISQSFYINE